ncbi:DUF4282 domain-containing protein [Nesterenkonia cremea]|uniref:DUF4282 domain-containing protein n=1 Tax=Nesterenkonia cremea TaxID=1882340 RepID=A0A917AQE6_9MICC|nr:DUF4282 domain-containing protein [Nesterenkonia cremea]GGE67949.1 hypothetical protein GCM10011401_14200 [Nesterenkonia cremea]
MTQQPGQPSDPNQPDPNQPDPNHPQSGHPQGEQPQGQPPQPPQGGQPPHPWQPGQPPSPYQPHPGQPHPGQQSQSQAAATEAKGFFGALFDFNFDSFVTIKFIKFIYILSSAFLVLLWLFYVVAGFVWEPAAGATALLLGWIPVILYVIWIRVVLEFLVSTVRTAQNTSAMQEEFRGLREVLSRR